MLQTKDIAISKQSRRQMATLLETSRIESARIRVENIIRSDITTELHEILELYCELLLARIGLLDNNGSRECDPGLEEAVQSIIYAAPKTDVKELQVVRQLLMDKFGKEFALQAMENQDGKVADRVLTRLRIEPPSHELVESYLTAIAEGYHIDWPKKDPIDESAGGDDDDDDDEGGRKVKELEEQLTTEELSKATPPQGEEVEAARSPVSVIPPAPSTDNPSPKIRLPKPPELRPGGKMLGGEAKPPPHQAKDDAGFADVNPKASKGVGRAGTTAGAASGAKLNIVGGKIPDVNELAARFAALKK